MANNYTQFSFVVPLEGSQQADWWQSVKDLTYNDDYTPEKWAALGFYDEGRMPEYAFCSIDVEDDGSSVWLWTDESGDCDTTAEVVRLFLEHFSLDSLVAFEVAFSCSKPRVDEFGGCAYAITKDSVKGFGTSQWILDQMTLHKTRN